MTSAVRQHRPRHCELGSVYVDRFIQFYTSRELKLKQIIRPTWKARVFYWRSLFLVNWVLLMRLAYTTHC